MTALQSIVSAHAEKSGSRTRRFVAGAIALLAATMLPVGAFGMDGPSKLDTDRIGNLLPLPPIPYLESMQWMSWKPSPPLFRIDTLLAPGIGPAGRFQLPSEYEHTLPRMS